MKNNIYKYLFKKFVKDKMNPYRKVILIEIEKVILISFLNRIIVISYSW